MLIKRRIRKEDKKHKSPNEESIKTPKRVRRTEYTAKEDNDNRISHGESKKTLNREPGRLLMETLTFLIGMI